MERKDQLPAEECSNCGKHSAESQSIFRKNLVWDNGWLCSECAAEETEWAEYCMQEPRVQTKQGESTNMTQESFQLDIRTDHFRISRKIKNIEDVDIAMLAFRDKLTIDRLQLPLKGRFRFHKLVYGFELTTYTVGEYMDVTKKMRNHINSILHTNSTAVDVVRLGSIESDMTDQVIPAFPAITKLAVAAIEAIPAGYRNKGEFLVLKNKLAKIIVEAGRAEYILCVLTDEFLEVLSHRHIEEEYREAA